MNKVSSKSIKSTKLAIAIATVLMGGYAGQSQAGTCSSPSPSSCTGAANAGTDITQSPAQAGGGLIVSTAAGFGIDTSTSGGDAIELNDITANNISFTDANASQIHGQAVGILITNSGNGTSSITTNGVIEGDSSYGIGIMNGNTSIGVTVSITDGSVTGDNIGIRVITDNDNSTDPILITTAAGTTVSSTSREGIYVGSDQQPLSMDISGDISANTRGIHTYLQGPSVPAHTVISTSGEITSGNDGIFAYHYEGAASDISITSSGIITAGSTAIEARQQDNNGNITIVSDGAITSTNSRGVEAHSKDGNQNITINGAISSKDDGIHTYSEDGSQVVTVNAAITSESRHGIKTYSKYGNQSLTINAPITADSDAIFADSDSGSDITITVNAPISSNDDGLSVHTENGDIDIVVSNTITAGSIGINTFTNALHMTTILLNSGAVVNSDILNNSGDSQITVNTGASVLGSIILRNGSDSLTFAGGDFSGVTLFDGGDDTSIADGFIDTLTFQGSSGTIPAANVTNWERIIVDTNSTVNFTGSLNTGLLDNPNGTVTTQDGTPGDVLTITGDFSGGGALTLEAELGAGGATDNVVINGVANAGNTVLNIVNVGGAGSQTVGNGILVIQVDNPSAGTFSLAEPIRAGDYLYSLVQVGNNWYLQSLFAPINIPTLSQWGKIALVSLLGLFGMFGFRRRS